MARSFLVLGNRCANKMESVFLKEFTVFGERPRTRKQSMMTLSFEP